MNMARKSKKLKQIKTKKSKLTIGVQTPKMKTESGRKSYLKKSEEKMLMVTELLKSLTNSDFEKKLISSKPPEELYRNSTKTATNRSKESMHLKKLVRKISYDKISKFSNRNPIKRTRLKSDNVQKNFRKRIQKG